MFTSALLDAFRAVSAISVGYSQDLKQYLYTIFPSQYFSLYFKQIVFYGHTFEQNTEVISGAGPAGVGVFTIFVFPFAVSDQQAVGAFIVTAHSSNNTFINLDKVFHKTIALYTVYINIITFSSQVLTVSALSYSLF